MNKNWEKSHNYELTSECVSCDCNLDCVRFVKWPFVLICYIIYANPDSKPISSILNQTINDPIGSVATNKQHLRD